MDDIMIERISPIQPVQKANQVEQIQPVSRREAGSRFTAMLQRELGKAAAPAEESFSIAFSKHAMTRAEERGIEVTPALIGQLTDSVERAQAKGATNILAMDTEKAFIINVPHGRVITAITQDEMKDSVFTNIDGAVFL